MKLNYRSIYFTTFTSVLALAALALLIFYMVPHLFRVPSAELDLHGEWEICFPPNQLLIDPSGGAVGYSEMVAQCRWYVATLPGDLTSDLARQFDHWILYRRHFNTPINCLPKRGGCSIVMGEVGDTVEVNLNGVVVGRRGDFPPRYLYSKHYPVRIDVSPTLLSLDTGLPNELLVLVYSPKKAQVGIRRGPLGIFEPTAATGLTRSLVAKTVVTPMACGIATLLLGLIGFFAFLYQPAPAKSTEDFTRFCFASSLFLVSFSEVPREFLPIAFAGHLHFFLRALFDWASFELVVAHFGVRSRWLLGLRPVYGFFCAAHIVLFAMEAVGGVSVVGFGGFDTAHMLARRAFPLMVLPPLIGFLCAWRRFGKQQGWVNLILFSIILPMQISDVLVFHQFYAFNYFIKFYPLLIALVFGWDILKEKQIQEHEMLRAKERANFMSMLYGKSLQIAHDIRSPLAALDMLSGQLGRLEPDKKEIISSAITRIRDIANQLLKTRTTIDPKIPVAEAAPGFGAIRPTLIAGAVESMVSEKRVQYQGHPSVVISGPTEIPRYGMFVEINETEFKSVMSNLIDNAYEATDGSGKVEVEIDSSRTHVMISVTDYGRGIPEEILPRLMNEGFSYGKKQGSGLGLYFAKRAVESWRGQIEIQSRFQLGTTITVTLPLSAPPVWFASRVTINSETHVIVIDDDSAIHHAWRRRFSGLNEAPAKVQIFNSPENCLEGLRLELPQSKKITILSDFYFEGASMDGLDLMDELEKLGLDSGRANRFLVTSYFDNEHVRGRCQEREVRVIPKMLLGAIPIRTRSEPIDLVLIDDDELVHQSWQLAARQLNKRMASFKNAEDFKQSHIEKSVPVYVDCLLGPGIDGVLVAKALVDLGYQQVYLATGLDTQTVKKPDGVIEVVEKAFPLAPEASPVP